MSAVFIDHLSEKPVLVEKADTYEGDVQVACGLQVVPGEGSKTPGIDGQAVMESIFGREVGDRLRPFDPVGRSDRRRRRPFVHIVVEMPEDLAVAVRITCVFRSLSEALCGNGLQHPDWIVAHPLPEFGVECGEQFAGVGIPGPPQVVGEFPKSGDLLGEVGHCREGSEMWLDRNHAGVGMPHLCLDIARCELLGPHTCDCDGAVIGLLIVTKEIFPVGLAGDSPSVGSHALPGILAQTEIILENCVEVFCHHGLGLSQVLEEDDSAAIAGHSLLLRPEAEAGLIGCDRRYGVRRAFQRRVPPRLVIGGEDSQVAPGKGLVIGHVDKAVMTVEIGGDEDHLDPVLGEILETEAFAGPDDGIGGLVLQPVGRDRRIRRVGLGVGLQTGDQVGEAAQDKKKGDNGLV